MKKSNLGVSVGFIGALAYLAAFVNSFVGLLLIVGYVLLREENIWLRKNVLKAMVLYIGFLLLGIAVRLIPNFFSLLNTFLSIFRFNFVSAAFTGIFGTLMKLLSYCAKLLYLALGVMALTQRTIAFAPLDKFIDKLVNLEN